MTYAEFAKRAESETFADYTESQVAELLLLANDKALIYDRNLQRFLAGDSYALLHNLLTLHYYICSGNTDGDLPSDLLYKKYDIGNQSLPVSSVSNGGSSVSMINLKTFDNADLFFNDLWRTPYGKEAYQIFENTKSLSICVF